MTNLINRLRLKADAISMCEKIEWGSETALMYEAAEALTTKDTEIAAAVKAERERLFEEIRAYTFKAQPYEGCMMRAFINNYPLPTEDNK